MTNNKSFVEGVKEEMLKIVKNEPMEVLYKMMRPFDIYVSGLYGATLMENLECLYSENDNCYNEIKSLINKLTDAELKELDELHENLYLDISERHQEDIDNRISKYCKEGGDTECLPNGFLDKWRQIHYPNDTRDLVELYKAKTGKSFNDIQEVYDFCEENNYDTNEWLYDCHEFNPTKNYILIALIKYNNYVITKRMKLINFILGVRRRGKQRKPTKASIIEKLREFDTYKSFQLWKLNKKRKHELELLLIEATKKNALKIAA